jgi:tousled-like kinase
VDVWSLGVIFYQMLFGKRPFGEGKSQERILSEGIMLNATQVEFPVERENTKILSTPSNSSIGTLSATSHPLAVPKVSDEAKDFIRTCLTWDQRLRSLHYSYSPHFCRPDVLTLTQHSYIRGNPKKSKGEAN